jgi:tetratricopeptide (TPR) repeat protein
VKTVEQRKSRADHDRLADLELQRHRTTSASTIALSLAPTVVHSHFRGSAPARPPPPPPAAALAEHGRTPTESRILSNLWLQSAATFRRWGKPEQCLVAIEEAEVLDPENSEVWVQLGLYHLGLSPPNYEAATPALVKSILLRPDHPAGIVSLAKLYLATDQVELAHNALNQVTQDSGWDVPEAWFYLAKVCERQGRDGRAGECLRYALGLEESRPARRWREGVERWL